MKFENTGRCAPDFFPIPRSSFPTSAFLIGREYSLTPASHLEFEKESSWISHSYFGISTLAINPGLPKGRRRGMEGA
jgi:hypothetical protein